MAKANAEAFKSMIITEQLATKQDTFALKQDIENVRLELRDVKHEILKWMVTAMIAQTALLGGIIAFLK